MSRDYCKHYTGLGRDAQGKHLFGRPLGDIDTKSDGRGTCRAGVNYNDVKKSGKKMIALPCFHPEPDNIPADGLWPTCNKCEWKTPDELAAEDREVEEALKRMAKAGSLVRRIKREHKGQSWKGVEKCPVCGGRLHLSHAGVNGHVAGSCETKGCLRWIE